jgi:hypothetical protein
MTTFEEAKKRIAKDTPPPGSFDEVPEMRALGAVMIEVIAMLQELKYLLEDNKELLEDIGTSCGKIYDIME